MLPEKILIERLAHIKQLFRKGVGESIQNENIAAFSILSFHDSIEMFLNLLYEHKEESSKNRNFLDYWDTFPDLTLKEPMKRLNNLRVNLKHKGLLPAKADIEKSRVYASDFFDQNTINKFGIEFSQISLMDLIIYPVVKDHLMKAQENIGNSNYQEAIEQTAMAFNQLISTYRSNKSSRGNSPFSFGVNTSFQSSFSLGIKDVKLAGFVNNVNTSLENLQEALELICYGIDYKEYAKFRTLTPYINRMQGGIQILHGRDNKIWTVENCQYCIDFVIKYALKLQDFDYDIASLLHPNVYEGFQEKG